MHLRTAIRTAVGALVVALAATAAVPGVATAAPGGELRVFTLEPGSLIPSEADDQASALVARQLYRGLVSYDLDGAPAFELAESIESDDNQLWSVAVQAGYAFHDGEPVDAASFIRGWEHARNGPYAHLLDPVVGLSLDGPLSFTVELAQPSGSFPALLGHPAFSPLAEVCLDDLVGCREQPIGNGPYQIDSGWQPGVGATLVRNEDYPDPGQALPDMLSYQVYPDLATGCTAFAFGDLDVMFPIPPQCRPPDVLPPPPIGYFEEASNAVSYLGLDRKSVV